MQSIFSPAARQGYLRERTTLSCRAGGLKMSWTKPRVLWGLNGCEALCVDRGDIEREEPGQGGWYIQWVVPVEEQQRERFAVAVRPVNKGAWQHYTVGLDQPSMLRKRVRLGIGCSHDVSMTTGCSQTAIRVSRRTM